MKLNQPLIRWGSLALVTSVVTLLAFTGGPQKEQSIFNHNTDTIPTQKRNKITREDANDRDLDKELRQLDDAKEKLEQMKDRDWEQISKQVEETIYKIDFDKIQQQVDEAVKRIDVEKMHREVEESLRRIDFDKIQQNIDQVNKEDLKREIEKARREVENALRNEEWKQELKEAQRRSKDDVQKELDNAKKEMDRVKEELRNQKFDFKKDMDKAREEVDKAREEMKGYQELIYEMEKDGLLNTKEDYSIEYKSSDLFINDKKQPQSVTDKYSKYFKKKNIAIKKQGGKMKINHQERSDTHLD
ncbi:hypothetical protein A4H97_31075 [Niastella yeongjuensis]|uniref:Uncharacterized protein n=1 Tax=Niastella yeongjuensis TaxID=354355 RepID=A0A1V9ENT5_9BACT|nr:hypothetical protein [Niastella yeongjuensis]OQP47808.1 hypothetical protein A4H97_31075 [Niastella yeongjuensis]SEP45159.1 hypothetical protein SAMN05660816_06289 [Niastella yeongjuensis]